MRSEWSFCLLGDICDFQEGYVNPSQSHPEYFDGDIKWLRAVDLSNSYVNNTSRSLTELGFTSAGKSALLFEPGTIAISKSGTIGRLGILNDYMCGNRAVINIRPNKSVDTKYIFYFLRTKQREFEHLAAGSVQKNLYVSALQPIELSLPVLPEQYAIGATLSCLDDKIELNNKINANLEVQAQAIYRKIVENHSPNAKLLDICTYSKEKIYVSELTLDSYVSTENMLPNKDGLVSASSLPTTNKATKFLPGDTLVSNIRPYFKKILFCHDIGGCSNDVLCFSPRPNYTQYLFITLFSDSFFDYMVAGSKGTKMPRGDKQQIMNYPIYIPTEEELLYFNAFVKPVLLYRNELTRQSRTLAALRDTLLPKLMSGEIEVPTAEATPS